MISAAADASYLYELLRKWGLSDFGARSVEFALRPVKIALILVIALVVARVGAAAVRRGVSALRMRAPMRQRSARMEQRARTIGDAAASLWKVVVAVVAVLMMLAEVGVNLAPLLAGAGIAGIAIAFGAQAVIRDYLSGMFILSEDQYGVGDVVTIGLASGTVEDLNLRVTRLRSADGTVWFIPNGEIRNVGNQSMEWSRALVDVTIGYDNDLQAVMVSIGEEARALAGEQQWSPIVLEPPEVQGVQAMATDGVTIRVVVKTAPREQWALSRELRARISDRMRRDGVKGPGRTVVVSSGGLESVPPPPPADS